MQTVDFVTCAGNVAERSRQWGEVTGAGGVTLLDDDGYEAMLRGGDAGVARICSVAIGGHRILWDGDGKRAQPAIKFVFQEEGVCLLEQGAKSIRLQPGQWCAYDKTLPFRVTSEGYCRQTALILPLDMSRGADRWMRQMMQGSVTLEGADYILHDSLVTAIDRIAAIDEAGRQLLSQALVNLAEITLLARGTSQANPLRDARRNKVLAFIDENLANPDLGIDFIADSLACSKRYLHKLFSDSDTTLARLIWNRRLDRAKLDLMDPALIERTITQVAFSWGFNDSHHFSRLFRERFGLTPRAFRSGYR